MTNRIFKKIEYKKGKAAIYWKNSNAAYSEEYFSKSDNPPGEDFTGAMNNIARMIPDVYGLPDLKSISHGYKGVPDPVLISVTWNHTDDGTFVSFILQFPTKSVYDDMEIKTPPRLSGRFETTKSGSPMFYVLDPGIDTWLDMLIIAANKYLDSPSQPGLFDSIKPSSDYIKENAVRDFIKANKIPEDSADLKQEPEPNKLNITEIELPEYPGYIFIKDKGGVNGLYECREKDRSREITGQGGSIELAHKNLTDQLKEGVWYVYVRNPKYCYKRIYDGTYLVKDNREGNDLNAITGHGISIETAIKELNENRKSKPNKPETYRLAGFPEDVNFMTNDHHKPNPAVAGSRLVFAFREPELRKETVRGAGISHEIAYNNLLLAEEENRKAGRKKKTETESEPDLDQILEGYGDNIHKLVQDVNTAAMTEIILPDILSDLKAE